MSRVSACHRPPDTLRSSNLFVGSNHPNQEWPIPPDKEPLMNAPLSTRWPFLPFLPGLPSTAAAPSPRPPKARRRLRLEHLEAMTTPSVTLVPHHLAPNQY